jgi:trimeric autotransporter adhesin
MKTLFAFKYSLFTFLLGLMWITNEAQVTMNTTGNHVQNFNSLAATGTLIPFADNTTIPNWYSQRTGTGTTFTADAGTSTGGNLYSYGTGSNPDRALGTLGSANAAAGSFAHGVLLKNTSGTTITDIKITYTLEQWRNGAAAAQPVTVYYKTSSSAITSLNPNSNATWTQIAGLTLNSPVTGGAAGAIDGNTNKVTASNVFIPSLSLADNDYIMIKWEDPDHTGTDHGLSIEDVTINWTVTPIISSNADLSNLTLSAGILTPVFTSGTTVYTSIVSNSISSITLTPAAANINATITVNSSPVPSGSPSPAIPLNAGDNTITTVVTAQDLVTIKTYTVTVTRAATAIPAITLTTPLAAFGNICTNTSAGPNSFVIDAADLDGSPVSLAALPGFSYSENAGGPFASSLNFSYSGNSFTAKQIYVQFNPTVIQSYSGNIILSGGGVVSYSVTASGSGINDVASVTTGGSSAITATTATAAGVINNTGCGSILSYGIEYSSTTGFPDGTGTKIPSSNLSGVNFSSVISGLVPNTRYFYKAYVTTGVSTAYGAQQVFTNTPLPVIMSAQPGLSYTQDFNDIAVWSNFFITGNGANHFGGLSVNTTGTIPDGVRITASTTSFQGATFGASGGVQRGTDQIPPSSSIVLLSTGATDNTSSAAIDFYMDFTGLNAGTLSFDWASVNNAVGDRNGSLRVYTSTDGITFTELTFASVLNFTNNLPTTGSKSNIQLPSSFNNNPNARLRFYYYNGIGGITPTGSRPKISIDNLNVTALANTPCVNPTAAATGLTFGTITDVSIQGSFTAASPATDGYLVVMSTNSSLTNNPVNGQNYVLGDNVGDGTVIAKGSSIGFVATGLTALTTYYFFIFPMNSICTGGPLYYTASLLNGSAATVAGLPPCVIPSSQASNPVFGTVGINSIQGSFTAAAADGYLVLVSTSASLSNNPISGTAYNTGDILGNATVVQRSNSTAFTANGLSPNTAYFFYIFSLNSLLCVNGPAYNTTSPLTVSQTTNPLPPCSTPSSQPTALTFTKSNNAVSGAFTTAPGVDDYLVVMSTSAALSGSPADNTDYVEGSSLGGGTVVSNSVANRFLAGNLISGTTYYFFIFAANKNCSGGTKYLTTSPLTDNVITTANPAGNYYFGTLHSHSDYSDGNQDNPGFTPTDDYNFAKNSQCMDFLGISEHNHFSTLDNPGNTLTNYHSGALQANAYTLANPNFLALYGMEWGVISGGGHVLIYGDGMDNLWGWESGSGIWGSTNNYDEFVAKSDYTGTSGLFKTVNDNSPTNTFASLAHPNLNDFNNIALSSYSATADNAITATAVESGPSTSTNTTYSNPGAPLFYLFYYQTLLSKGYHLGPTVDHDNHKTTFGRTTYSRTAIVAPALNKTEIIKSMRNMNFYATQDCDTKVDFTLNTLTMGSVFNDRYSPIISVNLTDATTNLNAAIIRVMYGVPGSGILPVKIDSAIGSSLRFIDNNLPNLTTGYYYIDISIGLVGIVTSPIWYTRNDLNVVLPITISSFTVQRYNNNVLLKWTTAQEVNIKEFIIERSADGINFQTIGTVKAAGNSSAAVNYNAIDINPIKGVNIYRLRMVDIDGKSEYSAVRRVIFDNNNLYSIYPNPTKGIINIAVDNANGVVADAEIYNMQSQLLMKRKINIASPITPVDISLLSSGIYLLKIITADGTATMQKFIKQ